MDRTAVQNPNLAAALAKIHAGFDALDACGVAPVDSADAVECIKQVENIRRRSDATAIELQTQIDQAGFYVADGHYSAKAMVAHNAHLSPAEAAARARTAKALKDLPTLHNQYLAGVLPSCHARLIGRVHSNRRVTGQVAAAEGWISEQATLPYKQFERCMRDWERLADADGPEPIAEMQHNKRNFNHREGFDQSWHSEGDFGSMQGADINDIFQHYVQAELEADWEKAVAEHGEDACEADLPRTQAHRNADALWKIFQDAAASPHGAVPPGWIHNVIWSAQTYEEMLRRSQGAEPQPFDVDTYGCETIDGVSLNPVEAIANALVSDFRRVIVSSKAVVIDQGHARNFTGNARTAVKMASTHCIWPGCHVPSSRCETDHIKEHSRGGSTNPGNGAPLCGRHNRWKQKGFSIHRDAVGQWHTQRPNGTEI